MAMNEGEEPTEGIRVNDRRRIDPETFEVREQETAPEPEGVVEADATDAVVAELTDDLRRVSAEYSNYRKRVERERETSRDLAIGSVLNELLPVLDDVERAREHGELEGAFKVVGENLEQIATRLGLERFGSADEPFDPMQHEALTSEEREGVTEPTVTAVYQPGYRHAGRVLRPARVAVAGA
jgi:molecular chaperone GrpE